MYVHVTCKLAIWHLTISESIIANNVTIGNDITISSDVTIGSDVTMRDAAVALVIESVDVCEHFSNITTI